MCESTTLTASGRLGHYELHGLLGAGAMGEVYRATDTKLGRLVALKVLPTAFAHDPNVSPASARKPRHSPPSITPAS